MFRLFSPLALGPLTVRNRIVSAPPSLGLAASGGFSTPALCQRYGEWAAGGVGLLLTEPLAVSPSPPEGMAGLYDDTLIAELARVVTAAAPTPVLALLSAPAAPLMELQSMPLEPIQEQFALAAWRARAAGCQGVMVDGGDDTLLGQLCSPRTNVRVDEYGGTQRTRLACDIVEAIRRWLGPDLVIGARLVVDELRPDGITLNESRVSAHQLVSAGANLLDVVVGGHPTQPIAQFPGWQFPLVAAIRSLVDVPVIAHGSMGDAEAAEHALNEGSADLIALAAPLLENPAWPQQALERLQNPPPLVDAVRPTRSMLPSAL